MSLSIRDIWETYGYKMPDVRKPGPVTHEPKTECFGYDKRDGVKACEILNRTWCAHGDGSCAFYKTVKEYMKGIEKYGAERIG